MSKKLGLLLDIAEVIATNFSSILNKHLESRLKAKKNEGGS